MNDDPIDFESLDPTRDPARWDAMVRAVTSRAVAARRHVTVASQVLFWARPTLAIAASVALLVWAGALSSRQREVPTSSCEDAPAIVLSRWALTDEAPETATLLQVLGDQDEND